MVHLSRRTRVRRPPTFARVALSCLAACGGAAWTAPLDAQPGGVEIRGRCLDGPASSSAINARALSDPSASWQVPLARRRVDVRALGGVDRSWEVETDDDGRFRLDTGLARIPDGTPFVASTEGDGASRLWSPSFDPRAPALAVFLYPLAADPGSVQTVTTLVHSVERDEDARYLRVQCRVEFWNWGRELYVGDERSGAREISRLPLPPGAEITVNRGWAPGSRGRLSEDGKFLIWDDPIPGLADLVVGRQSDRARTTWDVEYRVAPSAVFSLEYPLALAPAERRPGIELGGFRVYTVRDDMTIEGEERSGKIAAGAKGMRIESIHLERAFPVESNPIDGKPQKLDLYVPRDGKATEGRIDRGGLVLVPIEIADSARGVVSRDALFWHGGTVLVAVLAILAGLVLSRKGPPPEAVLDGLSSEEVLDRIAELDARFERGEIRDADYRRYRESLVAIAAEELAGAGGASSGDTPARPALADATRELLRQLGEIESRGATSSADIQQRAHLLEALYKALRKEGAT